MAGRQICKAFGFVSSSVAGPAFHMLTIAMKFLSPNLWWVLMPIIFFGWSAPSDVARVILSNEEGGFRWRSSQKLSEDDISMVVGKVMESLKPIVIKAVHDQNIHLSHMIKLNTEEVTKSFTDLREEIASVRSDIESIKTDLRDARRGNNNGLLDTTDTLSFEVEDDISEITIPLGPHPSNCAEVKDQGHNRSGVYFVSLPGGKDIQVYCDMTTGGEGWTVIQRRGDITPHVDFNRGWSDYEKGFGDLEGEFWLGLDNIHSLTSQPLNPVRLRVDLEDWYNHKVYAEYDTFIVWSEGDLYSLLVRGFSGRGGAGDSLIQHTGDAFSTFDRDNDGDEDLNRAYDYGGGWWHSQGTYSFLNGPYHTKEAVTHRSIFWWTWKSDRALKQSEMKIRPYH